MHQAIHLKINGIIKLIILCAEIIFFYIFFVLKIDISCLFKTNLGIRCPGCGLTRAFRAILSLDFTEAIKYNILSIPLFVAFTFLTIVLIIDIVRNRRYVEKYLKIFSNYYVLIIILVIITMFINNLNQV